MNKLFLLLGATAFLNPLPALAVPPKKGEVWTPQYSQITCDTDAEVLDIAKAGEKKEDQLGVGPMGRKVRYYADQLNDYGDKVCAVYEIVNGLVLGDLVDLGDLYNSSGERFHAYLAHVVLPDFPDKVYPVLVGEDFYDARKPKEEIVPQTSL
jgi:hypothetical protein